MRMFNIVVVGILWCTGAGLYIGAVEYPQELELSIGAVNEWLEPRTGFVVDTTPKRVGGGIIVAASVLSFLLRLGKSPSARKDTASRADADLEKTLANLERDVHRAEAEMAAWKSHAEKFQTFREKLATLQGQHATLQTEAANQSDSASPKCSHKKCVHGECLNHKPEWENVGGKWNKPNPGAFGVKTYRARRHCGKAMMRYKLVQTRQCKKCDRTRDFTEIEEGVYNNYLNRIALCSCCGYSRDCTFEILDRISNHGDEV